MLNNDEPQRSIPAVSHSTSRWQ